MMGICIIASEVALRKCEVFQFSGLNGEEEGEKKSNLELIWNKYLKEFLTN